MKKTTIAIFVILFASATYVLAQERTGTDAVSMTSTSPDTRLETAPFTPPAPAASDSCETHQTASKCVANNAPDGRKCCWKGSEDHPRGGECSPCGTK